MEASCTRRRNESERDLEETRTIPKQPAPPRAARSRAFVGLPSSACRRWVAAGELVERDNAFDSTSGRRVEAGQAFEPPYDDTLDKADMVPDIVVQHSGVRWSGSAGDSEDDE